jgi:energy-coupling factor transport system permease protein
MASGFGNYKKKNNVIYRMNPAVKFVIFLFHIAIIFASRSLIGYAFLGSWLVLLFILSQTGIKSFYKNFRSVVFLFIILLLINWIIMKETSITGRIWLDDGETKRLIQLPPGLYQKFTFSDQSAFTISKTTHPEVYKHFSDMTANSQTSKDFKDIDFKDIANIFDKNNIDYRNITLYIEGVKPIFGDSNNIYTNRIFGEGWYALSEKAIVMSSFVSLKIFFMITAASILVNTTSNVELTYAIEDTFKPLKIFKLPVNVAAMIISVALSSIPSLVDISQTVIKAQSSRGMDFKNSKLTGKMKSIVALVVPMVVIAFQRADDLANAMTARSYNVREERTRYRKYKIHLFDYFALFFAIFLFSALLTAYILNFFFVPFAGAEAIVRFL